ncbi:helix-turn-helix domain-containing protein [Megamonas hypermegale]|uniref:helix-turn-helix domain-containing protein n=1 Tax=Megamonas hypermegale TaxID=158847 RepID=UPI0026EF2EC2|nr:helix-turn-helix transcriptional regulator [Megamonas hypermegale]
MSITAERLRELREKKGLSQSEVAKFLGISRPAYVKYETGNSRPVRKLKELCVLFNVSSDYILGTEGDETETEVKYSADEQRLIEVYRKLDERGKKNILRNAEGDLNILEGK